MVHCESIASILFVLFIELVVFSNAVTPLICKENEKLNECFSPCGVEPTCDVRSPIIADVCIERCDFKCVCKDGYIRDKTNGTCIKIEACPPRCGCNEVLNPYFSPCTPEATCDNPNPVTPKICPLVVFQKCLCKSGYIRVIPNGTCIKKEECPCKGEHEVRGYVSCCGPPTCQQPICQMKCLSRFGECVCKDGYVYNKKGGKCIPLKECPKDCVE